MTVDPITLEVVRNRLGEIVGTMERLLFHSGYSPILRESFDGSACILDGNGQAVVGSGMPIHLFPYYYTVQAIIQRHGERMRPGDAFILNDPYVGGSLHVPDVAIVTPVFYQGQRVAFCASIAHKPDIGGLVAGSSGAGAREIFHEGLLIPGVRYWTSDGVNPDVEAMLRHNSRTPDEVLGDLRAQVGCTRVGRRRLMELCDEYGVETVTESFELLIQRAERLLRMELLSLPDGEQEAEGFLDDDGVDLGHPVRFHVRIRKQGEEIEFDYSGSNPQVKGPVNLRPQSSETAAALALIGYLDPSIPINDGPRRLLRFVNPPGLVTNVQHPAPINTYYATMLLLFSCVQLALSKFDPARAIAPPGFSAGGITFGYAQSRTGQPAVQYELIGSSLGGTPAGDGAFGTSPLYHITTSQPVEILETEYPLQVTRFELLPDSAGDGKHRGGPAYLREYRLLTEAKFSLRRGGARDGGWGVVGGHGPRPSTCIVNPGTDCEERLPALATRDLKPGDIVRLTSPGGGGYGSPLERDPLAVLEDVRNGLVSREVAREVYGVVVRPGLDGVDEMATAEVRGGRRERSAG
ncbi:MAG: hydantoinase B/oxoprolinase family protein [Chloroflexi bacterium]|nr:hydantoinase B/oxoprolinase family protein [Chloroflexota bacterium]